MAETVETLIAYCREDDRVCPQPENAKQLKRQDA